MHVTGWLKLKPGPRHFRDEWTFSLPWRRKPLRLKTLIFWPGLADTLLVPLLRA